mmetsp:Transcript_23274/g.38813  ORF Transcript_23274/g.38813 Transcript_23274/m.38813 type:complete len:292 (-) Transcript_23274:63-938(-)
MKYVKAFRIIDIPLGGGVQGSHSLYLKEHESSNMSRENSGNSGGKTLFVGNVDYRICMDIASIQEYLTLLFSRFGDIASISLSSFEMDSGADTRFAHIVFAKKSNLKLALTATDIDYRTACKEVSERFGPTFMRRSIAEIRKMVPFADTNPEQLQLKVDAYMEQFEEEEQIMIKKREEALSQIDEDGFMPVKHRSKRKRSSLEGGVGIPDTVATTAAGAASSGTDGGRRAGGTAPRNRSSKKKNKDTELKNFYRFQIKEDRMKDLDILRKKFNEDKQRVAKQKEARQFRPF